jgi:enoyl-CoA hydratase/carnithine racemase
MDPLTDEHLDVKTRTLTKAPNATVYEIVLSRPEKRNALPDETIELLAEMF